MTFDPADLSHYSSPRRTSIANANGVVSPVTGAGSVTLSPSLQLFNTLLVPSLSHKLLSDILTKEIIGRGTKRGGLYYMEDFSMGRAHHGETLDEELKWLTFEWFEDQNDTPSEPLVAEPIPPEEEPLAAEPIPFEEEESPLLVATSPSPENIPEAKPGQTTKQILPRNGGKKVEVSNCQLCFH
ncbi:retrovirus-related pol polyprotein from transposon RE2 [Fagus crenata]